MSSRLALGTVQFGLPYGIANRNGEVLVSEAEKILESARSLDMDTLDTAIGYGQSEQRLGAIGVSHFRVVSKLPAVLPLGEDASGWVQNAVVGSLARLKISKLGGLLLHRSQQLLQAEGESLYKAMCALRDEGVVEKIGVSIYSPDELDTLCPRFKFDLVQAPFNVIDRRLLTSGWLSRLHQAGTEVHVRSVFLQGLLLMDPVERPDYFAQWSPLWMQWSRWLNRTSLTPVQACLAFAMSHSEISRVVVGVDRLTQLLEIAEATKIMTTHPQSLMSDDVNLINPSLWPKF